MKPTNQDAIEKLDELRHTAEAGGQTKAEVQYAIDAERVHQVNKHGFLSCHGHSVGEWLLILEKKLADAKLQWYHQGDDAALLEILKLTAAGESCIENCGVVTRTDVK